MTTARALLNNGIAAKQDRSRLTYERLIATGFSMLKHTELSDIPIARLTQEAGCSVGGFYARFHSKAEFFIALVHQHLESRTQAQQHLFATLPGDSLVKGLFDDAVSYYWNHRKFWRAVLTRGMEEPGFWEPIRRHHAAFAGKFVAWLGRERRRSVTRQEAATIAFAFQMTFSAINSALFQQRGLTFNGKKQFVDALVRAFRMLANLDALPL